MSTTMQVDMKVEPARMDPSNTTTFYSRTFKEASLAILACHVL